MYVTDTEQQPSHSNEKAEIPYHKYQPKSPQSKGQHNNIEYLGMINCAIIRKLGILLDIFNQLVLVILFYPFHELRNVDSSHSFYDSNCLEDIEFGLL